jgi:hypothetical protein
MPISTDTEDSFSQSAISDVVDVVDRVALIENLINQIIVGYCKPRKAAWEFMWSIVLDTSVMSLGAKVKVISAVSHEMNFKLDKDSLHRVIALRNAFAHHASDAHSIVAIGRTPEENSTYFQFWVLEGSGKISRIKRHEAFAEFNVKYRKARESLEKLLRMVKQRFENADT